VVFIKIITNFGNAYHNGIFKNPLNELYVFDRTIITLAGRIGYTYLAVNGRFVKKDGLARGGSNYGSVSTSVVLKLKKGDQVGIFTNNNHYIHGEHSSVQGLLLKETQLFSFKEIYQSSRIKKDTSIKYMSLF